jgi:TRAP-type C4-dicarboxylate transport system substrate-binding protein
MFTDLSTEWAEKRGRAWDDINAEGVDHAIKMGLEVIRLSPQEAKRWEKAVQPLEEEYVKKMVAKGVAADQSKKQIAFAKERIAYWTKKQIELGIKSPTGPAEMRK